MEVCGLMGVSERHGWRLLAAYREEGSAAVAHGSRGEEACNHRKPGDTTEGDGAPALRPVAQAGHPNRSVEGALWPHLEPNEPRGGMFLWVRFPDGVDTRKALESAREAGVAYNPGPDWAVYDPDDDVNGNNYVRLCYAPPHGGGDVAEGLSGWLGPFSEPSGFPKRIRLV